MKSEEFQKAFPEKKPTIAIVGAGSMGSLIGAKIAATGAYNVAMVSSWEDHIHKINASGLLLTNVDQSTQRVDKIYATNRPEVDKLFREFSEN
jgi:ketopantoate reductase